MSLEFGSCYKTDITYHHGSGNNSQFKILLFCEKEQNSKNGSF